MDKEGVFDFDVGGDYLSGNPGNPAPARSAKHQHGEISWTRTDVNTLMEKKGGPAFYMCQSTHLFLNYGTNNPRRLRETFGGGMPFTNVPSRRA